MTKENLISDVTYCLSLIMGFLGHFGMRMLILEHLQYNTLLNNSTH